MKTKPCRFGSISASLPACIEKRLFRTCTVKAHYRSNGAPLFLLAFSVEIQESAHSFPTKHVVIARAYETYSCTVRSLRAVYPYLSP